MQTPMPDNPLPSFLSDAAAEFVGWWSDLQEHIDTAPSDDSPLYHYTNAQGLTGILNTEQIW
jgi:hypothetical protein